MKQEVLFIILNEYARLGKCLSCSLSPPGLCQGSEIKYVVKTVAPTLDAVRSLGGFRTLPELQF